VTSERDSDCSDLTKRGQTDARPPPIISADMNAYDFPRCAKTLVDPPEPSLLRCVSIWEMSANRILYRHADMLETRAPSTDLLRTHVWTRRSEICITQPHQSTCLCSMVFRHKGFIGIYTSHSETQRLRDTVEDDEQYFLMIITMWIMSLVMLRFLSESTRAHK